MKRNWTRLILLSILSATYGCGSTSVPGPDPNNQGEVVTANPDGDPTVSAEDGGPGFTGEGWTTSTPGPIGDPKALKGGTFLTDIPDWPENLRLFGTGSNTQLNYLVARDLLYETLVDLDDNTFEFIPELASHWWISEDKMTIRFRIDPKAHWSDGEPVVAEDVRATWKLLMDDSLIDPMGKQSAEKFLEPIILSKYIVEIQCTDSDWRNFNSIGGSIPILPAHEIGAITGKEYLEKYNFQYTAVSGPYYIDPRDIKDNESITATRRKNYWAADKPRNRGRFNFDKLRWVVVRDRRLAFDKTCKGELDFHAVMTAAWWVEDLPKLNDLIKGRLIRQKVFTKHPASVQGLAFNMRKPPFDDVEVRKALAMLWDRRTLIQKFAYDEYEPLASFYPGGEGQNPNNQVVEYEPRKAADILAKAGWSERGDDGILMKGGQRLSFVLSFSTRGLEKYFTSYKESCKAVGVEVNLEYLNHETLWKNVVEDRKFEVTSQAWGAVLFPNPESSFHSSMADPPGSNNITGLKNAEIDQLIAEYNEEFEISRRNELLREIDGLLFNSHQYAYGWWSPSERLLYWNKFGMPEAVLPRHRDFSGVFIYWWADPDKSKNLAKARTGDSGISPRPDLEIRTWLGEPNKPFDLN